MERCIASRESVSLLQSERPGKLCHYYKVNVPSSETHHFETAGCDNQVVDDVVDLCDQGQDGRLCAQEEKTFMNKSSGERGFMYLFLQLASVCEQTHLFCRGRAQVLVPLQETLAESRLIGRWLHPGEGHLTLATHTHTHTSLYIAHILYYIYII